MNNKLRPPIFVINCKAYLEMMGERAVEIAKIADQVSRKTGISFLMIAQLTDIRSISTAVENIAVFAPHLDPIQPGGHTGHILPEALKEAGAVGSLINHAERRLALTDVRVAVERAHQVGLRAMVCTNTPLEAQAIAVFQPDIIVVEPPELIGTGRAVSKVMRDFTPEAVKAVKSVEPRILVFTGAGITYPDDAEQVIRAGAEGTGGAKFLIDVDDKQKLLTEMAEAVQRGWRTRSI